MNMFALSYKKSRIELMLNCRRGHTVLQAALPPKQEYILMITMSQTQKMLYKEFMDNLAETSLNTWATTNPLKAFSVCCKVRFKLFSCCELIEN